MRLTSYGFFFVLFLSACSTGILRLPASLKSTYDPTKTKLLREAAKQGVMFQFDDDALRDVPGVSLSEKCQLQDEKQWAENFFDVLKVFDENPQFYKKIHVIYFRRGEKPSFEINEDKEDGNWAQGKYLTVTYKKNLRQQKAEQEDILKCDPSGDMKPPQATYLELEWPKTADLEKLMEKQPDKKKVSRFEFDTGFLSYLANRMTIVRLTSAWAWEKSLDGTEILPETMNRLSDQVRNGKVDYINYWLDQIDQNSRMGRHLKFFAVLQDQRLARGVGIDGSAGTRMLATVGPQLASTFLYVSYRSRAGTYQFSSLNDLNDCLKKFEPSGTSMYGHKSERYLHPGYSCDQD